MRKIKYMIGLIVILSPAIIMGCDNYDEVPPRTEGFSVNFVMPTPPSLTTAERAEWNAVRAEYESSRPL